MIEKGKIWKFSGVILIVYVIIAGLLIPLKSGIESVEPSYGNAGETLKIQVTGYNTHFKEAGNSLRAWLKWENGKAIAATEMVALDERRMNLTFSIPNNLPENTEVQAVTLLIDSEADGTSVLPSAIFLTQTEKVLAAEEVQWVKPGDFSNNGQITFPFRNILGETIRNTYFHVPLWFGMMFLFLFAVIHSIKYLRKGDAESDLKAEAYTWGAYWSWDIKQNMTVVALLIYAAYFILRASFEDPEKRARVCAAYGIFAFSTLIPLIYVIPRLTDSLHPGSGGNPAFGSQDLDNTMRMVFYPAVIGFTLFGFWLSSLQFRYLRLQKLREDVD